jgi:hypothetical protein
MKDNITTELSTEDVNPRFCKGAVRRSTCCNSEVADVPAFYNTTMKLDNGEDIPNETLCLKCGHRCSTGILRHYA